MYDLNSRSILLSTDVWLLSGANLHEPLPPDPPVPGRTFAEAVEQVVRSMRSSIPLNSLWRIRYAVDGVEYWTDPIPIGEYPTDIRLGAVYVGYELVGVPIVGGPWYIPHSGWGNRPS